MKFLIFYFSHFCDKRVTFLKLISKKKTPALKVGEFNKVFVFFFILGVRELHEWEDATQESRERALLSQSYCLERYSLPLHHLLRP